MLRSGSELVYKQTILFNELNFMKDCFDEEQVAA